MLKQGFERFRNDLIRGFSLEAYDLVSISSINNAYFERNGYWKNGNFYDLLTRHVSSLACASKEGSACMPITRSS